MANWLRLAGLALVFISGNILAQTAVVRGFVKEVDGGEPVIFTNVYLRGTNYGAATDINGYFQMSKVPPGNYVLTVTALGYDTLSENISLSAGQIVNKQLYLTKQNIEIAEVEISAEKIDAQTKVQMSVVKATPKEIKAIPTIGGSTDIVQYLQVLPGVVFTGDQGGQLYIRGGTPIQNKVLLDGATIYNPFHSIGLFSVFNTDIIRNADIYTGGFGAQYGGRISSIMDITTVDGNKQRLTGSVTASTFLAEAMLQGPLSARDQNGNASTSFVLTAKHSYLDQSSQALYSYIDREEGLPFTFTDLYGKVSASGSSGTKASLFGFYNSDAVQFTPSTRYSWVGRGVGLNAILAPPGVAALIEAKFSVSGYELLFEQDEFDDSFSTINSFELGLSSKYFQGENEMKFGMDITGFNTEFELDNGFGSRVQNQSNNTDIALWGNYRFNLNRLVLDLGARAVFYSSIRTGTFEPRFGAKYNLTDNIRLKTAYGFYTQNLISLSSDRDVVNLFYGMAASPDEGLPETFTDRNGNVRGVTSALQSARHYIAGMEIDLGKNWQINAEAYIKDFIQLSNINRDRLFDSQRGNDPRLYQEYILEEGDARGVDLTFKFEKKEFYLWAVYSLTYVDRWDERIEYQPIFDRRHNANLLASYNFGKNKSWQVSARWNFGSGFPFTQTQGVYLLDGFEDGINTDVTQTNSDNITIQYGDLNAGRLPTYHRFDFSAKKTIEFSKTTTLEINASITNLYDRDNIFYVNRITNQVLYQLPIIPSAGATLRF